MLEGGHARSVRAVVWKPTTSEGELGVVTGSFDGTAGVWRRDEGAHGGDAEGAMGEDGEEGGGEEEEEKEEWEFSVVLEGHDAEIKSVAFSPSGQYLATCSRDKSVWVWEEVDGAGEWETIAVLTEHEADVKMVAWAPGWVRGAGGEGEGGFGGGEGGGECLASASYDGKVRIWREDGEGEWGCVGAVS